MVLCACWLSAMASVTADWKSCDWLGVSAMPGLVLPLMGNGPIVCRPLTQPVVDGRLEIASRSQRIVPAAATRFLDALAEFAQQGHELPNSVTWPS
jgi:DNA-binding transcriptional LysR family regulator